MGGWSGREREGGDEREGKGKGRTPHAARVRTAWRFCMAKSSPKTTIWRLESTWVGGCGWVSVSSLPFPSSHHSTHLLDERGHALALGVLGQDGELLERARARLGVHACCACVGCGCGWVGWVMKRERLQRTNENSKQRGPPGFFGGPPPSTLRTHKSCLYPTRRTPRAQTRRPWLDLHVLSGYRAF